jgi:hypothetical protein
VEIEKLLLTACESANIDRPNRIDSHTLKRWLMCNQRNIQPPVVFKPDEAAIEQVIDARHQQQSVLAIQSFLIGCVAPRLTMARHQMNGISNDREKVEVGRPLTVQHWRHECCWKDNTNSPPGMGGILPRSTSTTLAGASALDTSMLTASTKTP